MKAALRTQYGERKISTQKIALIASVIGLIVIGHWLAEYVSTNKTIAWLYVTAFYAGWLIVSISLFLKNSDIKQMFRRGMNMQWILLPSLFAIPITIFIFIPNIHLLQLDKWLAMNIFICLINPFMEEIYWRGLASRISNSAIVSFLFSTIGFAASHPLIFGVNSPGVAGWIGFAGTFAVGAAFWFCYFKTKTLWSCIIAHFLIDVSGMAVFILANKATLAPINF